MNRIIELDWLRVLVFGLLILYHMGMLYTQDWGWHYKSEYQSAFLANLMLWSNQWRMSLLFFISGAAVSFMLARDHGFTFLKDRVTRLFLPIVFGALVIVVPQVYIEANTTSVIICPNFFKFWGLYLNQHSAEFAEHKKIGSMHLTLNHLWFLPYILAYSLILWIIYPVFQLSIIKRILNQTTPFLSIWLFIVGPIIGHWLIGQWLYKDNPVTHNFVTDWFNHARSFFCFVIGFVLVRLPSQWCRLQNFRWYFLGLACLTFSYCLAKFHGVISFSGGYAESLNGFLWSANVWLWLLCVIAFAQAFCKNANPVISYLNKGVFCFYVFHQTFIIVFAYWLSPFHVGPFIEPFAIGVLVVVCCLLAYELFRRLGWIGLVVGINPKK